MNNNSPKGRESAGGLSPRQRSQPRAEQEDPTCTRVEGLWWLTGLSLLFSVFETKAGQETSTHQCGSSTCSSGHPLGMICSYWLSPMKQKAASSSPQNYSLSAVVTFFFKLLMYLFQETLSLLSVLQITYKKKESVLYVGLFYHERKQNHWQNMSNYLLKFFLVFILCSTDKCSTLYYIQTIPETELNAKEQNR